MRFGPILVPAAIVVSVLVIVGAESGWFDGPAPTPAIVRAEPGIHGAASTAPRRVATSMPAPTSRAATSPTTRGPSATETTGRSAGVEKKQDSVAPAPVATTTPALAASRATPIKPVAADDLEQARREAERARQDVVNVTQASIAAQAAAETEKERLKTELEGKLEALQAKLDEKATGAAADAESGKRAADDLAAARAETVELKGRLAAATAPSAQAPRPEADAAELETLRRKAGETARAEAAAATAAAELADARDRENDLRQKLAGARDEAEGKTRGDREAAEKALADARRTVGTLQERGKDLEGKLAALSGKAAAADEARKQLDELRRQVAGDAQAAEAARTADGAKRDADARAATELRADLAGARRGQATLRQENAMLQRELVDARQSAEQRAKDDRAKDDRTKGEKVAAAAEGKPDDAHAGRSVADERSAVALAAALRTAEAELSQLRAARAHDAAQLATLHGLLASLGPPRQQGVRILRVPGSESRAAARGRTVPQGAAGDDPTENKRLNEELASLQRQQMHMELQSLKKVAAGMTRHRERRPRERAVEIAPRPERPSVHPSAVAEAAPPADDDAGAVISQSNRLIRAGNVDQARQLLRQRGGRAATKALADTYNPLANTQYGAIGVDSDADRAAFLYQQAARLPR